MAELDRRKATDIQIFTVDQQDMIGEFESGTVHFGTTDVDGSGARDVHDYPVPTKENSHLDVDAQIAQVAVFMPLRAKSVFVVYNTGAGTYEGQALVATSSHELKKGDVQREKISFKFQGAPTLA